ncbi:MULTISPECIES: sporulation protein YjcZ [unclassified Paenibacillus]|nr:MULTISPECIES: sporulation protein YjcZ [unclassified Paenibacillus]QID16120.1 sporulation protein YjcZ [Paenibacillus sp. RUD330]SIQ78377.1 hypothetical protein SAMN05880555_2318 [Paenibacillus sp. RU4X]SIQ99821.1 hypothetical protein SAMN05880570_2317 [Paenibacillus sp. RU4T]
MSEYVEGAETKVEAVRGGVNSTGIILVLFILLVIISSIFFV